MRKMKKLAGYLLLLAIPVAIAAGLFIFNGSGYRLSEHDAADIAYKNAGVKTSEISQSTVSKARSGLHGSYEISFTTSDNHFEYTIDGQSGSILKHKSDHPTTKDEDDAQKGEEPKDETQPSESKEETAVSKETAQTTALNHAGLAEGSVTNLKTELKTEGDGKVYNISFDYAASGLRYKYAVNADSGAIVAYTTEYLTGAATPAQ
ncbi:PepSY domain-containing protein [Streptococcus salivarius]|uniref:PepSY domain-containing protein n=1 Tax=Streptococcus salivarius TaxID=1304 RepID=UPI0016050164|nr:PepSY domain-containing protein [Streptococcus salivarius]